MDFINDDKFPKGLRVLAVDHDPVCLKYLGALLTKCGHEVTTTQSEEFALDILRKKKKIFDIVITDVVNDKMRLLKIIGVEMDIPVIMVSPNGDYETVSKATQYGACDSLVKPISLREIQKIWQHVLRHRLNKNKFTLKETERNLNRKNKSNNQIESNKDEAEQFPNQKTKKASFSDPELCAKFVEVFHKLGDQAVPSIIHEEMNVPGLTREQVDGYLQRYRKKLKKEGQMPDNITASNGRSGNIQSSTFPSLRNSQSQNGINYISGRTSQLSHHDATHNASIHPFVNPQPCFVPTTEYTSHPSSSLDIVNQNLHNQIYASGSHAQNFSLSSKFDDPHRVGLPKFPNYNANTDSRESNFQFGETSTAPPNNLLSYAPQNSQNNQDDDLTYYPTLDRESSSNFDSVIQNDEMINSGRVDQIPSQEIAFYETDNIDYLLGDFSSVDDDLSAAVRLFQSK
ncbi:hypothetical protein MKW92_003876 [Papaver armeniacum]|nr:hypothetical protein MKW92_003876 [Papaver armeniacum]